MIDYTVHPWIDVAVRYIGITEVPGPHADHVIAHWLDDVGAGSSDETSWCSAAMHGFMKEARYDTLRTARARDWLDYGVPIEKPNYGAVAVFWRNKPNGWQGHVGFWIRETEQSIWVLGGNQNNSVCVAPYPKARFLGCRWPVTSPVYLG
jgi:uncharacterized protein (TIGR02594 family)